MYEVKIRNADSGKLITTIKCGIDDFVMVIRGANEVVKWVDGSILAYKDDKVYCIRECWKMIKNLIEILNHLGVYGRIQPVVKDGKALYRVVRITDDYTEEVEDLEFYLLLLVWSKVTNYIVERYPIIR